MANILALDTTTEACSVALLRDNDVFQDYGIYPREHTKVLLPMIKEQMELADLDWNALDAIAVTQGPGAFTGIRIGVAVAQGLAFANDLPLIGVSTLATVAQGAYREMRANSVRVVMDARMGEVYWNDFQLSDLNSDVSSGIMLSTSKDAVARPQDLTRPSLLNSESVCWVGSGLGPYKDELVELSQQWGLCSEFEEQLRLPQAIDMLSIALALYLEGKAVPAALLEPQYVRNNVAKKKREQKAAVLS
jgi:tRNA threonylcarbamoyladenosine biosynthesis protein TsaB